MLVRITTTLCLILSLVAGFFAWDASSTKGKLNVAENAVQSLSASLELAVDLRKAEQVIASEHSGDVIKETTNQEVSNAKLRSALKGNAPWSDQLVPSGVVDALGL